MRVSPEVVWSFHLKASPNDSDELQVARPERLSRTENEWPWRTEVTVKLTRSDSIQTKENRVAHYLLIASLWNPEISLSLNNEFTDQLMVMGLGETHRVRSLCSKILSGQLIAHIADGPHLVNSCYLTLCVGLLKLPQSKTHQAEGKILLSRSCDGVPLLPKSSSACVITRAFMDFLRRHGPSFGLLLPQLTSIPSSQDKKETSEFCEVAVLVKLNRPELARWNVMTVFLHLESPRKGAIKYGTLAKTFVEFEPKLYRAMIKQVHNTFNKLKLQHPKEFESIHDNKIRECREVYAPSIASSITDIFFNSPSPTMRLKLDALMNMVSQRLETPSSQTTPLTPMMSEAVKVNKRRRTSSPSTTTSVGSERSQLSQVNHSAGSDSAVIGLVEASGAAEVSEVGRWTEESVKEAILKLLHLQLESLGGGNRPSLAGERRIGMHVRQDK
eukprot:GHVN01018157.1.p1 GENE.GHVN01018157.1~~GHVN01018157.1.p1  ORF type:complete len:444 (+),score=86.39 GHVN01018157.1:487-1818(+)